MRNYLGEYLSRDQTVNNTTLEKKALKYNIMYSHNQILPLYSPKLGLKMVKVIFKNFRGLSELNVWFLKILTV